MKNRRCLNPACPSYGTVGSRSIIHNGFYRTRSGKRRRYRCGECGKTFSSTKGTPYYRLQHRRATFDGVIALRVEGVSISSISRIKGIAWNTVARWLEGCVPRSVEKERRPPLRHQSIISGGNLRVFENLAQTSVAVDAS